MKKSICSLLTIILILSSMPSFSQTSENFEEKPLNDLKAPSNPASIIIGNQVSVISRPKSWEELEANVFSNFLDQNNSFTVPNDFALEFSPYWSNKKRRVSIEDFVNPDLCKSILQSLSFSVSSTQNFMLDDSTKSNAIGFGVRTLLSFHDDEETKRVLDALNKARARSLIKATAVILAIRIEEDAKLSGDVRIDTLISRLRRDQEVPEVINYDTLKTKLSAILKTDIEFSNAVNTVIEEMLPYVDEILTLSKIKDERQGFKIEVALATSLNFPTNKTEFSMVPKTGFWITPSYQPGNKNFEFLGVFRYFHYYKKFYDTYLTSNKTFDNTIDFGARIAFKKEKFTFEAECVGRSSSSIISREKDPVSNNETIVRQKETDIQWVLNFNYEISDNLVLSYNFGRQFEPSLSDKGTLISMATLNLGFGAPKIKSLK